MSVFRSDVPAESKRALPRLFAAVGPFGSGKTTLVINTIRELVASGRFSKEHIAYVLNDEGMHVDGALTREAEVRPMVNGCFTCSDVADLRRIIAELTEAGMRWIFLEGFGITSGSEIKDFLESLPNSFDLFCVVDAKHFGENLVRYGDLMANQIRAATCGIGVTKYPDSVTDIADLSLEYVVDCVAEHGHGQSVYLIPPNGSVPLEALLHQGERHHAHKCSCGHVHHHGDEHGHHDHGHHHDHGVHGIVPYHFQLRTDKEHVYSAVMTAFEGTESFIARVKGACDGTLFNMVHGTWERGASDSRWFVTFYSVRPIEFVHDLPGLLPLIVPPDESRYIGTSYQLLRRESGTREETVAAIERLLAEMPPEPILVPAGEYSRLITHPEHPLQEVKELSRRPSVVDEWFPKVLARCMEYWIDAARVLRTREAEILPAELPTNKRELAVSIAWWLDRFPTELSGFRAEADELRISELCAEGILPLTALNSDAERRYWQERELLKALAFSGPHKDRALVRRAIEHLASLGAEPQLCVDAMEAVLL